MLKRRLEKLEQRLEAVADNEGTQTIEQAIETLDKDGSLTVAENLAKFLDELE